MPPTPRKLGAGPCTVADVQAPPAGEPGVVGRQAGGNVARDRRADAVLRAKGWRVLRFWEHEDPDAVADAICAALGRLPQAPSTAPP